MSKTMQYFADEVTKKVDKIILQVKQNLITKSTAAKDILSLDNLELIDINAENVDEVIEMECQ